MVDSGNMQLHDSVTPALVAGKYRFDISTNCGNGTTFATPYWVNIESPRYKIDEHELISVYPMAGSSGSFDGELPWAALRRRTLPWERRGSVQDPSSPWLALVLTRPDEVTLGNAPLEAVVGATAAAKFDDKPSGSVAALQFPNAGTMMSILPTEPDARLLCHVREVNLADTDLAGMDDDGWVAVVMANRVVTGTAQTTWRATLVSLEHRDDLAAGHPETASVLALAAWEFTATGVGSFQKLISSLKPQVFGEIDGDPQAGLGVALTRTDHTGAQMKVLYQSPLAPPPANPLGDEPDITELAAHELGRLMAAADGRLLRELIEWRRSNVTSNSRWMIGDLIARSAPSARAARVAGDTKSGHLAAALSALDQLSGTRLPGARPAGHPSLRRKREEKS
jgi:hypothetical protein